MALTPSNLHPPVHRAAARSTRQLRPLLAWFAALICGGPCACAEAQVNTEALRVGDPDAGFSGNLSAGLDFKRGAVKYLELVGSSQLIYFHDVHTLLLNGSGAYGTTQGERFQGRGFGHLRWTAMWRRRLGSEIFTQLEYDQFLRQQLRALFGLGPRALLVCAQNFEAFLGVAYMLEREVLDIPASDPHPQRSLNHRLTSYLSLKWSPNEHVQIVQTFYVQPRLTALADVRMLEQADVRVAVGEQIGLKTSLTVHFDNRPPTGVAKANLALTQGVDVAW